MIAVDDADEIPVAVDDADGIEVAVDDVHVAADRLVVRGVAER
jgi:hypothetical protein